MVSIADKMDTIIGCFGVGLIPTGTSDPFALRRQTLGIINIILGKGYRTSLHRMIQIGMEPLVKKIERPRKEVQVDCLSFFRGRFVGLLTSQGYPLDVVEAVLASQFDDLLDARARVEALARFRDKPAFEPVAVAFKRVANILKGVDQKGKLDPTRFETPQEKDLHKRYQEIAGKCSALIAGADYEKALGELAKLRPPIDALFDHVMVMAEDKRVQANRLALLDEIEGLFSQMADFSHLAIGEES